MQKNRDATLDMTQGSPAKLLILFAIPMWIGAVFQLMYNMVDTIVVGRFVSIDALAAIGAAGSTSMFIMLMGNGLTNGISVIISQAEGAKRQDLLKRAVTHAVYLVLAGSLVLGLASFFGARPMMELLGTPDNIIGQSVAYIQITGGLSAALFAYNGVSSVLRAGLENPPVFPDFQLSLKCGPGPAVCTGCSRRRGWGGLGHGNLPAGFGGVVRLVHAAAAPAPKAGRGFLEV